MQGFLKQNIKKIFYNIMYLLSATVLLQKNRKKKSILRRFENSCTHRVWRSI